MFFESLLGSDVPPKDAKLKGRIVLEEYDNGRTYFVAGLDADGDGSLLEYREIKGSVPATVVRSAIASIGGMLGPMLAGFLRRHFKVKG